MNHESQEANRAGKAQGKGESTRALAAGTAGAWEMEGGQMKIVINKCYGGFGLSQAAYERLIAYGVPLKENAADGELAILKSSIDGRFWASWPSEHRTHHLLVRVVEKMKARANGACSDLKVIKIPDGVDFEIEEYDGMEWISEVHRTWS